MSEPVTLDHVVAGFGDELDGVRARLRKRS